MSDIIIQHFKSGTFQEQYWIPTHNKRRESQLFRDNKKFIRDECGAPCWICGSRRLLEVHHVFEWAFWNAIDPQKVTNILKAIEFYDLRYTDLSKQPDKLKKAVADMEKNKPIIDSPDDIRNLVVLCREHHRFRLKGVHTITMPIWLSIAAVPSEAGILTKEQIIIAAERVRKIDEELAALAENNYKPHR